MTFDEELHGLTCLNCGCKWEVKGNLIPSGNYGRLLFPCPLCGKSTGELKSTIDLLGLVVPVIMEVRE